MEVAIAIVLQCVMRILHLGIYLATVDVRLFYMFRDRVSSAQILLLQILLLQILLHLELIGNTSISVFKDQ